MSSGKGTALTAISFSDVVKTWLAERLAWRHLDAMSALSEDKRGAWQMPAALIGSSRMRPKVMMKNQIAVG